MPIELYTRRRFTSLAASSPFWSLAARAFAAPTRELLITSTGAVANNSTVNTRSIQAAIDQLAAKGGGTVVVPKGVFVSGALFFKPKVNLRLTEGAVLKCSTDLSNFPAQRTRIEGHFLEKFTPAFINAKNCNGDETAGNCFGVGELNWVAGWPRRERSEAVGVEQSEISTSKGACIARERR